MNVQSPPALEAMVREKVQSGRYRDESEVVSEALRLLDRAADSAWMELTAALAEGDADIDAGRVVEVSSREEFRALIEFPG